VVVLLRPGASQAYPLNPDIPAPINGYGGYGAMNIEEGLQFPQWNLPCVPMDTGAENWFAATPLNAYFLTRSARPVWDLSALSSFAYSENGSVGDGQGVWNGTGVKGGGFTLVGRKGQGIAMMMRFTGVSAAPETTAGNRPTTGLAGSPLSFNRIAFPAASAFDGKGVVGFTLQFDTGLSPNMELDGTFHPYEINAGTPNCTLSVEFNALNAIAPPGWDPVTNTKEELVDVPITINIVDGGTPTLLTFTMKRLHIRDPRNRQGTAGRAQRTHTYDCLATTTAQPLAIT
jgi:hypothetical protein